MLTVRSLYIRGIDKTRVTIASKYFSGKPGYKNLYILIDAEKREINLT